MRMIFVALPITIIILLIITEKVTLRVRHKDFYTIDIDLNLLGLTITTEENTSKNKKKSNNKKDKNSNSADINGYLNLFSLILYRSHLTVKRFTPIHRAADTPLTLFPSYVILYSILNALVRSARSYSFSENALLPSVDDNLDVEVKIRLYNVIISLLRYQYYKKAKSGGKGYV